ncbi:MAG: response regulator transcription factor [Coriobacteriia bacterium]|nr:response regulator transcription factor [Coriobacteriia bacterium]
MRHVLIVSDDDLSRAWIRSPLDGLDVVIVECGLAELPRRALDGNVELVILDGGRSPEALTHAVENAASGGAEVKLLVVVESEALSSMRLPVQMPSDFLVRGSSSEELAVRVRNLLWPGEEVARQELIRVENLTLNLATYQAHIDGQPIDFTYLEYALFAFLLTHPGRTYSREVLLRRVWGSDYYGGSRTVDVHIRRIRAKLGAELSRRLDTVRNVGYLWNA